MWQLRVEIRATCKGGMSLVFDIVWFGWGGNWNDGLAEGRATNVRMRLVFVRQLGLGG